MLGLPLFLSLQGLASLPAPTVSTDGLPSPVHLPLAGPVETMAVDRRGRFLALLSMPARLDVWDLHVGRSPIWTSEVPAAMPPRQYRVALSHVGGKLLVAVLLFGRGTPPSLYTATPGDGDLQSLQGISSVPEPLCLAVHPDLGVVVGGRQPGSVNRRLVSPHPLDPSEPRVFWQVRGGGRLLGSQQPSARNARRGLPSPAEAAAASATGVGRGPAGYHRMEGSGRSQCHASLPPR